MSASSPQTRPHHVRDIVEQLNALTDRDRVSVEDVVHAFGERAFVPVMMVPALVVVSPLSGIPFVSTVCGLTITLVAGQLLMSRTSLWLPPWLMRCEIAGVQLHKCTSRMGPIGDWIDRRTRDRMSGLVSRRGRPVIYMLCLLSGLTMPFLELVPFSSSLLGMSVLCLSSAILAADGLVVAFALVFIVLAALVPLSLVGGIVAA